jgi:PAS domain S-box-containing protein
VTQPCDSMPNWNEQDRLKAIESYDILDSPKEEEFDDIVKMAAEACHVPISLISFVANERQWFKAVVGTDLQETPLDVSICSHAILQRELFVVPDTSKDSRFQNNPLVKGDPHIRFYAGALLETTEGLPLGTVCILDYKPRALSDQEAATLKSLARQVMTQLELRRALSDLRRALKAKSDSEERLGLALEASGFVGIWEWDIIKNRVYADARFVSVFGGEPHWSTEGAPIADYLKTIHFDDLPRVKKAIENAIHSPGPFQEEYRLVQKDGSVRWIEARGRCHFDETGKAIRFPGVATDVTARKESEQQAKDVAERYRFVTESMPHKISTTNAKGDVDFVNQEWMEFTGLSFEQLLDWGWTKSIHPDDLDERIRRWKEALAEVKPFEMECRIRRKDGTYRWHHSKVSPMRNPAGEVIMWIGSNADIDDQLKGKEDLQEAVAKFGALFDQSSVFAGIMSLDGTVLEANRIFLEACGYGAEEVMGKKFWDCAWWRGSKEIQNDIRNAMPQVAAGIPYLKTSSYWVADGSQRMVDLALHPIRNDAGEVIFIYPTGMDVTERYLAEARADFLSQLTQKLSTVSDPAEINRVATHEIGQFFGAHRCYFFETLDPGQIQILPDWRAANEKSLEGIYRLADFGTAERWRTLHVSSVCIHDVRTHPWTRDYSESYRDTDIVGCMMSPFSREGKWVACIGVSTNHLRHWLPEEQALLENAMARVWPLIERARVEVALRQSEERFRAMSDNIAPLAWMANADGVLFWYNKRWYDYTGETFETMQSEGWTKVHDPVHLPRVMETWKTAVANGHPWEDTFPLRSVEGKYRWFLSRAYPIRDAHGKVTLWFGVNTDITDLQDVQNALREANTLLGDKAVHLESIVQERTKKLSEIIGELESFSYSISHDMRAPLRSMIGFSEALKEDYSHKLEAEGLDYLNRISNASRRMDQLIQDVLAFSRLSREDVVLGAVDTEALMREIIHSYPNLHYDKIDISIKSPLPSVKGTEALLTQCFSNLLENAAKFASAGVKAHVQVWGEIDEGRAKLFFKDEGIGISENHLDRIFDIFHRVGRDTDGTGIGLAIVRKAVEKMNGTIGVKSELGNGSLFWLNLQPA